MIDDFQENIVVYESREFNASLMGVIKAKVRLYSYAKRIC